MQKVASDRLVTRSQAARMLGMSTSTLRRRVEHHVLSPRVDGRGVHLFDLGEVMALRATRSERDAGAVSAEAFKRFKAGEELEDVASAMELTGPEVCTLYEQWISVRELSRKWVMLPRADVERVGDALGIGTSSSAEVAEILRVAGHLVAQRACACGSVPTVCASCSEEQRAESAPARARRKRQESATREQAQLLAEWDAEIEAQRASGHGARAGEPRGVDAEGA
jgi:hypothetical protein